MTSRWARSSSGRTPSTGCAAHSTASAARPAIVTARWPQPRRAPRRQRIQITSSWTE